MQEDNRDTDCVPLTSGRRPGAHSFEEGFSEAATEVSAKLGCSAAAQFSRHFQIQKQPPEDYTDCSYAEVRLVLLLPQLPTKRTKPPAVLPSL